MPRRNCSARTRRTHRRQRTTHDRRGSLLTTKGQCYATSRPKQQYPNERDAWEACQGLLRVYRCPACSFYHTSSMKRVEA